MKLKKKKSEKQSSIFELFKIEHISTDCYYEDNPPQYPEFKVNTDRIGLFSNLSTALKGMREHIEKKKESGREYGYDGLRDVFGFLIKEFALDKLSCNFFTKSIRNYLPNGSLLDECLTSSEPLSDGSSEEFLGRPADKVRFRNGDLVEELMGHIVKLTIVGTPPWSPEKVNEYKERCKKDNWYWPLDSSDDRYDTLEVSKGEDHDTHGHPDPVDLFPLRFPVSNKLRKNLEKQYHELKNS
jgi:hypothetical protein